MGLPFRLQILDLKLIKSVDEQEITLEESDKTVGGRHYSPFPPILDPPGKGLVHLFGIYKYYTTFVDK